MRQRTYSHKPFPPQKKPPLQRAKALAFIREQVAAGKPFPSNAAICAYMGWQAHQSVRHCLDGLSADGHVERVGLSARGSVVWRLRPESHTVVETQREAVTCGTEAAGTAESVTTAG